jgi:hypothetical protein
MNVKMLNPNLFLCQQREMFMLFPSVNDANFYVDGKACERAYITIDQASIIIKKYQLHSYKEVLNELHLLSLHGKDETWFEKFIKQMWQWLSE